jgi:hypothetical protein
MYGCMGRGGVRVVLERYAACDTRIRVSQAAG